MPANKPINGVKSGCFLCSIIFFRFFFPAKVRNVNLQKNAGALNWQATVYPQASLPDIVPSAHENMTFRRYSGRTRRSSIGTDPIIGKMKVLATFSY